MKNVLAFFGIVLFGLMSFSAGYGVGWNALKTDLTKNHRVAIFGKSTNVACVRVQ